MSVRFLTVPLPDRLAPDPMHDLQRLGQEFDAADKPGGCAACGAALGGCDHSVAEGVGADT